MKPNSISLKKVKFPTMYPYINTNFELKSLTNLSRIKTRKNTLNKKSTGYVKPKKDIKSQISQMSNEITHYSLKSMSTVDRITRMKTENDVLVTDLQKNVKDNLKNKKKATASFQDLIDIYFNKGYRIPNFQSKKTNLFNQNPLMENKKNIEYFYEKTKGENEPQGEFDLDTYDEKNYKYLNKLNYYVQQCQNFVGGKTKCKEAPMKRKITRMRTYTKDNEECSKDIELLKSNLKEEEAHHKICYTSLSLKTKSHVKGEKRKRIINKPKRKSLIPSFARTATKFNTSTITAAHRTESTTFYSSAGFKTEPNESKIEHLYNLRNKLNFKEYIEAIEDYYQSEGIEIKRLTMDTLPYNFRHNFNVITNNVRDYNVTEIWGKNYNRLGRLGDCDGLLEENKNLDKGLQKLEYEYVNKFITIN